MAKVFISHRGADKAKAEKMAQEIQACGHTVWFDAWKIDIGDFIVGEINEGLAGADYLILCLSSSGSSGWMDREWMSALARQLEGAKVKLLPAKLSGGDLPAILADIKYADLVADWAKGVSDLLKAIR